MGVHLSSGHCIKEFLMTPEKLSCKLDGSLHGPTSQIKGAAMNKQHVITLAGKEYVLFAGLLDEAHKQGLEQIETNLVQAPSQDNPMAVVSALVKTSKGSFSGLGDASPDSVNDTIAPHLIRMAETRAVARALRFTTNIGFTALEELGRDGPTNGNSTVSKSVSNGKKGSMTQEEYILKLIKTRQVDPDLESEIHRLFEEKKKFGSLSVRDASRIIDKLKECKEKGKPS